MPSELLDTLLTTQDRELLRAELENLKSAVFKVKENNFADVLKHQVRANVAEIIEREVRTQEKAPEVYLAEILSQIDAVPSLELTVAFEPSQAVLEQLASQASTLLGQPLILQLSVQTDIIGGAVITWNGRYHDGSLKKKFNEVAQRIIHEKL